MAPRLRIRTLMVVLAASALLVQTIATASALPLDNSTDGKGRPARTGASTQAEDCSLRASANRSVHDEWAHCISVSASISRPPAVGQTATLRVTVTADVARPGAVITIELPSNLTFVATPTGAVVRTGRSSSGRGAATLATTRADFAADSTRNLIATLRATASGTAHVRVRVTATTSWGTDGGSDDVFLTIGSTSGTSRIGFDAPTTGGVTRALGTSVPNGTPVTRVVPMAGPEAPLGGDTSCVYGSWHFLDHTGTSRPSVNYSVQAWDSDTFGDDFLGATHYTSSDGSWWSCFDTGDEEGGGQEVYVHFISRNGYWRVRNSPGENDDYVNTTPVVSLCWGCDHYFGALSPVGGIEHRGMNAYNAAYTAWRWKPSTCWDANDEAGNTCRQLVINWTPTSTDGTYYSPAGDDVHLAADDPNSPTVVLHEMGHAIMDDVYEDDFPPTPDCSPHTVQGPSSAGCAWTEGFAEWFAAAVLDDPFVRWPTGASVDLENHTWGSDGWTNGDTVEGRVAGAMIDISDYTNEAFWDRFGEGAPGKIWTTFLNDVSDTFLEFWGHRALRGFEVAVANGSVYQNTIDYDFRDPLGDYAELTRPTPTPHNYRYNTTTQYWSVVAVRPPLGADYDLALFDDVGQTVHLATSNLAGSTIDFVAVDSSHRPTGDYYPQSYVFGGTGSYGVELAQGANQLTIGSETVTMGANDVALVRDSAVSAFVQATYFRVAPSNGGQDPELFLMKSDGIETATWVQPRAQAVATSSGGGPGVPEGFSYTAPATDWYGLVLTNVAGSGSYSLHVDTSAPTGSVLIDGGGTVTRDPGVTLTLAATDAETGILDMRVAVDGVVDREATEPFAASRNVTLPGADGVKTVAVEYRNQAGMTFTVTDTITLDTRPNLRVTALTDPPASLTRGESFSVTDTTRNTAGSATGRSRTAYVLSTDTVRDVDDWTLAGIRFLPDLAIGEANTGTRSVTVGETMPPGTYYVLACADSSGIVDEFNEGDNCRASATTTVVRVPNLRVAQLSDPPASRRVGSSFDVTDRVENAGNGPAGVTTTNRYYLSLDMTRNGGDVVLTSNRTVPRLLAGESDTRTRAVTIPTGTPAGTYHLIACSDWNNLLAEYSDKDNCRAKGATIQVT